MADILIVDDLDRTADLCRAALPDHRFRGPTRNWRETAEELGRARGKVDVVLLDVHFDIDAEQLVGWTEDMSPRALEDLKRVQGLKILERLHARYPELPVVLMTSRDDVRLEDAGPSLGAVDFTFFLDDDYVDARSLATAIASAARVGRGREADGPVFWGRTLAMRRVREQLEMVSSGRLPVLLLGPTGTGKSLLARHIVHPRSKRKGRFVAVDLSTLPSDLVPAHLFGSVRGAYTGSTGDKPGAFESAHEGTLFLDEIGNLSPSAQKMLLSVLQEGRVTRLGDLREREVDVKLVAATNEDLRQRVREGSFRADLYMRLNPAASVVLPSLGDRGHDLERLLGHAMGQALARPAMMGLMASYRARHGIQGDSIRVHLGSDVPEAEPGDLLFLFPHRVARLMQAHSWPGNLREFAMVVENALWTVLQQGMDTPAGGRADVLQIPPKLVRDLLSFTVETTTSGASDEGMDDGDGWSIHVQLQPRETLNKVAQDCERQYFQALFLRHRGNFGAMAEVLLGDASHARKVQLRLNQLGLKVRELKELLP